MRRKPGPFYDFWHPRVEGQIRDAMHAHPHWFVGVSAKQKGDFINSLAKRIVGEIGAGCDLAPEPPGSDCALGSGEGGRGGVNSAASGSATGSRLVADPQSKPKHE